MGVYFFINELVRSSFQERVSRLKKQSGSRSKEEYGLPPVSGRSISPVASEVGHFQEFNVGHFREEFPVARDIILYKPISITGAGKNGSIISYYVAKFVIWCGK